MAEAEQKKTVLEYDCECCGGKFTSHRARQGEKLCKDCIELRRSLKGFVNRGLSEADVMKRAKKLLPVEKK